MLAYVFFVLATIAAAAFFARLRSLSSHIHNASGCPLCGHTTFNAEDRCVECGELFVEARRRRQDEIDVFVASFGPLAVICGAVSLLGVLLSLTRLLR
ncbi:MAG: hypothetical protein IBJ18_09390 [Phycisphaerales bacterium]|nr:hypothetical protein [Phycisphaerales bacterium]